ncbi:hypothetical protein GJ698_01830 [Pseudoduganella sp. FT26W]|uniref:Chromosome partitioning protein ParB n=1 Tax=Duganella aquatilis TaxID=2666082 RepID=A0A844D5P7_9BURK|nr:hypothetical protein [Duganella aquatilis]MRW82830.1 hypothetical protein [Duganella aquatilis]
MKQVDDKRTGDLLDGFKRPVGRPRTGKARTPAERKRDSRARLLESGEAFLTVRLPVEVIDGVRKFREFKDLTNDQIIERLLRQQLLRKR